MRDCRGTRFLGSIGSMSFKTDWLRDRRGRLRPVGPGEPAGSGSGHASAPGDHAGSSARGHGRTGPPARPPSGLSGPELAAWAAEPAERALASLAEAAGGGHRLRQPLVPAALLFGRRAGLDVDAAHLLARWTNDIRHATSGDRRFPWASGGDESLGATAELITAVELLRSVMDSADPVLAESAERILDELRPAIEDAFSVAVMAIDPTADTLALWLLAHHPLAMEEFRDLSVATASRYGAVAHRNAGFVFQSRLGMLGGAPIAANTQLAAGIWALGLYPTLIGRIIGLAVRQREEDGSWSDRRGPDGVVVHDDLHATLVAADLLLGLDPDFDPDPTIERFVDWRGPDGWWRLAPGDSGWVTPLVLGWLERTRRPFAERFSWPAAPKTHSDRKTGQPRYEYLADFGRALRFVPSLARRPIDVAFCDLAGFGDYNEAFGQTAGDTVLAYFATSLATAVPGGRVIRDGGDEFIVVGPPTWSGLRAALDGFSGGWPDAFRARFGPDAGMVRPRFVGTTDVAAELLAVRDRLGREIFDTKRRHPDPPEGGVIEWA